MCTYIFMSVVVPGFDVEREPRKEQWFSEKPIYIDYHMN